MKLGAVDLHRAFLCAVKYNLSNKARRKLMTKKKIGGYQIPFNKANGDQLDYEVSWSGNVEMRDNFEFEDTLTLDYSSRGRSAVNFRMIRESTGTSVNVFLKDFTEIFRHSISGKIAGRFTFVKRGANYGCTLLEVAGGKMELSND